MVHPDAERENKKRTLRIAARRCRTRTAYGDARMVLPALELAPQCNHYRLCQSAGMHKTVNRRASHRFVAQTSRFMARPSGECGATHVHSWGPRKARERSPNCKNIGVEDSATHNPWCRGSCEADAQAPARQGGAAVRRDSTGPVAPHRRSSHLRARGAGVRPRPTAGRPSRTRPRCVARQRRRGRPGAARSAVSRWRG